jgi:hypothetical protein
MRTSSRASSAPHRREGDGHLPGAHVQDDRHVLEALRLAGDQVGEVGQQLAGQVVDADVAQVLEELGRGGLAGAGEPRQDHDVLRVVLAAPLVPPMAMRAVRPSGRSHAASLPRAQRPPARTRMIESS